MTTTLPGTLMTPRLKLRAPVLADASRIAMFIGEWDVAKMLSRVPYPYREADAIWWINNGQPAGGRHYVLVHANGVIGVVGIDARADGTMELGYWLAKPFWGRGLMTEAAGAVVAAYRMINPKAPLACSHFDDNPGSKRVIEKLGFEATGERSAHSLARHAPVTLLTYRLPVMASAPPPTLIPA